MTTIPITYQEVKVSDKISTNGKDNHMFRKLNFNEVEVVKSIKNTGNTSSSCIFCITFESGNTTWGFGDRVLEKIVE